MIINGTGITNLEVHVNRGYTTQTHWALQWVQGADGNWHATDRGASEDFYEASFSTFGRKSIIDNIISKLYTNMTVDAHVLTGTQFATDEKIFGPELAYSSVQMTVLNKPIVKQVKYNVFQLDLTMRCLNPSSSGTATFSDLKYLDYNFEANEEWYATKSDTYSGAMYYSVDKFGIGIFQGSLNMTEAELIGLRRCITANRGASVSVASISGLSSMFGPGGPAYPCTCKILDLSTTFFSLSRYIVNLKLAQVV